MNSHAATAARGWRRAGPGRGVTACLGARVWAVMGGPSVAADGGHGVCRSQQWTLRVGVGLQLCLDALQRRLRRGETLLDESDLCTDDALEGRPGTRVPGWRVEDDRVGRGRVIRLRLELLVLLALQRRQVGRDVTALGPGEALIQHRLDELHRPADLPVVPVHPG